MLDWYPDIVALGEIRNDAIWTGKKWVNLHGREILSSLPLASGGFFWPLEPHVDDVEIYDIARGLANECRFGSQTPKFVSVARHSVMLSNIVKDLGFDIDDQKWALLHDAPEAYLSDVPKVLKRLPEYDFFEKAEEKIMNAVVEAFELSPTSIPDHVDKLDKAIAYTEMLNVFGDVGEAKMRAIGFEHLIEDALSYTPYLHYLQPREAEVEFLQRFDDLF